MGEEELLERSRAPPAPHQTADAPQDGPFGRHAGHCMPHGPVLFTGALHHASTEVPGACGRTSSRDCCSSPAPQQPAFGCSGPTSGGDCQVARGSVRDISPQKPSSTGQLSHSDRPG